jgi:DNA-binding CsgD family transcriptional regulator
MAAKSSTPTAKLNLRALTVRERAVAAWLGEDETYARIAARLGLKHDTVRGHARAIFAKLGVRTRPAAVARLLCQGIRVTQKGGIDRIW